MLDMEKLSDELRNVKVASDQPIFEEATPDVAELAKKIIAKHHPELVNIRMTYSFSLKPKRTKGMIALAWVQRPNKLLQYFSGENDILMFIDKKVWELAKPEEKEALIDHELCHIVYSENRKGDPVYKLRDHEVFEFNEIILRYGGWSSNLRITIEAAYEHGEENKEIKRLNGDFTDEQIDSQIEEIQKGNAEVEPTEEIAEPEEKKSKKIKPQFE